MNRWTLVARRLISICILSLASAISTPAQISEGVAFFRQNCANCHTIGGGRLTGPDLKDVSQRRSFEWLVKWLQNPKSVIDSGDPYALKLVQDSGGVVMPTITGMTPTMGELLVTMIETESKLPKSQFAGSPISDKPFTPQDVGKGLALFRGTTRLINGGPPCISCHTMKGIAGLGGGRLGPDLTLVYERLQGRKALGAWLLSPASPTMQPIFAKRPLQPEEIYSGLALFEDSAKKGGADNSSGPVIFFLLGLGTSAVGLVALNKLFSHRFRGVRHALVHGNRSKGDR